MTWQLCLRLEKYGSLSLITSIEFTLAVLEKVQKFAGANRISFSTAIIRTELEIVCSYRISFPFYNVRQVIFCYDQNKTLITYVDLSSNAGRGRPRRIYNDLIGEVPQKRQVRSTRYRRACMAKCMNVDEAMKVCEYRKMRSVDYAYP